MRDYKYSARLKSRGENTTDLLLSGVYTQKIKGQEFKVTSNTIVGCAVSALPCSVHDLKIRITYSSFPYAACQTSSSSIKHYGLFSVGEREISSSTSTTLCARSAFQTKSPSIIRCLIVCIANRIIPFFLSSDGEVLLPFVMQSINGRRDDWSVCDEEYFNGLSKVIDLSSMNNTKLDRQAPTYAWVSNRALSRARWLVSARWNKNRMRMISFSNKQTSTKTIDIWFSMKNSSAASLGFLMCKTRWWAPHAVGQI